MFISFWMKFTAVTYNKILTFRFIWNNEGTRDVSFPVSSNKIDHKIQSALFIPTIAVAGINCGVTALLLLVPALVGYKVKNNKK